MSDLDRIFQELSEIRQQLENLPADALDEAARLESRREELHAEASELRSAVGDPRSSAEIRTELDALQEKLRHIEKSEINIVEQYGGSMLEGSSSAGGMEINRRIEEGQGADELKARIELLENELAKRRNESG